MTQAWDIIQHATLADEATLVAQNLTATRLDAAARAAISTHAARLTVRSAGTYRTRLVATTGYLTSEGPLPIDDGLIFRGGDLSAACDS